jgi:hypothetical protein
LDVVEALTKTTAKFADRQSAAGGTARLTGAQFGFNKDSQFNVFEEDGNLVFFREVNGIVEIIIQNGNSGYLDLRLGGYEGIIEFGGGDPAIQIIINQNN